MPKILVIDDDEAIVEIVKETLLENNYEVITASEGGEGLLKVQDEQPDLVLLDVVMPLVNGYMFLQDLKTRETGQGDQMIPIIVLTAKAGLEEVFKREGVKGYLVKPVEPSLLIQKVEECLKPNG